MGLLDCLAIWSNARIVTKTLASAVADGNQSDGYLIKRLVSLVVYIGVFNRSRVHPDVAFLYSKLN
ncbi:hypothetical protein PSAC2689_220096 [Paraburkholderia sacchari]